MRAAPCVRWTKTRRTSVTDLISWMAIGFIMALTAAFSLFEVIPDDW